MNFCFFAFPHSIPARHETTKDIAKPVVPNHIPPADISFMSPIPIGELSDFIPFLLFIFSNKKPINEVSI